MTVTHRLYRTVFLIILILSHLVFSHFVKFIVRIEMRWNLLHLLNWYGPVILFCGQSDAGNLCEMLFVSVPSFDCRS